MNKTAKKEIQEVKAKIEIARKSLYVFKESKESEKWHDLLNKADTALKENNVEYANILVDRVNEVVDKAWKRIFRWNDFQREVTKCVILTLGIEIIIALIYLYTVDYSYYTYITAAIFGAVGGTLGIALNIGHDLVPEESNRLQALKLILRPMIGMVSGIILNVFITTKIVIIAPTLDQATVLIGLSILAGYSERFISLSFERVMPKVFQTSTKKESEKLN